MKRAIAVALFSLVLSSVASAKDLIGVFEDALANDPAIREADATRRAAREARPQAWAALLPQLSASAVKQRDDTEQNRLDPVIVGGSIQVQQRTGQSRPDIDRWSLDLRQSVFRWEDWVAVGRAASEVAQAEAQFQAAEQDLILRVSQRYFDVLAARDALVAEETALDAISRQLEQADKRFEVGLIAITDVQEARSARDSAAAAVIAAKRQLATAQELLREITNELYEQLARPDETMPLRPPQPADPDQWVEAAMNQNLALISSRLAADIARANVRAAWGGYLPALELTASRSHFEQESTQNFQPVPEVGFPGGSAPSSVESDNDTWALQVTVPLFAGGLNRSRHRESQFRWIAARERVVRVSRETERLARDAFLGVTSEIARVNALRQAVESSQTALKATEAGYEVGTRTAVDVLDARRTLVQAQTNYARSRYDYLLNVIRLRSAAGNLDRESLVEINEWLQTLEPLR